MTRNTAIQLQQVGKSYRLGTLPSLRERLAKRPAAAQAADSATLWALRDVDLSIAPGETVGLIGPNGAGKTTILKLIAGITKPTTGTVHVQGRVSSLIELGAGFHPDLTGRENVFLNGAILGLRRRDIEGLFDRIVAFAELERFIDTPVKRYSSGMYARLGFAVAAHVSPDILLVDEVLSVGDAAFQRRCYEKVWELVHHEGRSVIMVSHGFGYIRALCNRVVWLQRGQVQQIGEPDAVIRAYESKVFSTAALTPGAVGAEADGQVQIVSVTLLDRNGAPASDYGVGDAVTVRIGYLCAPGVAGLTFAVGVMRDDTLNCYTSYADECGFALPAHQPGGILEARYAELRLMPGSYQMYVTALSSDERRTVYTYRTVGFHVVADQGFDIRHGSFYNIPAWRLAPPQEGAGA
jgi:lipopolysaccharide transport system ATP-binding protein